MEFKALSKYVRYSPYKLRPIADVIRGKSAEFAVNWLSTFASKRVAPIQKTLESALANAKDRANHDVKQLVVQEVRIDQGPIFKYFKPGAMGRATIQRRRLCHIKVVVAAKQKA